MAMLEKTRSRLYVAVRVFQFSEPARPNTNGCLAATGACSCATRNTKRLSASPCSAVIELLESRRLLSSGSIYVVNERHYPIEDDGKDGEGIAMSDIVVSSAPPNATITSVDVSYKIVHPYAGDLRIWLTAQQGHTYTLWDCAQGANPEKTVTGISSWNTQSPNRTWTLSADDVELDDSGRIEYFKLWIHWTAPDFTPVFRDARITNKVDQDRDGYARSFDIEFDVDSNIPGTYYVKAYEYDGGSWLDDPLYPISSTFGVNGSALDWRSLHIECDSNQGVDQLSHGVAEFKLELYDAATRTLKQTWYPTSPLGPDLVAKVELPSEDVNHPPAIGYLSPSPDPIVQGRELTLTANSTYDPDADDAVEKVQFYRDSNGNSVLDPSADAKLGEDTSGSDGWSWKNSTGEFSVGNNVYFARAYDGELWSTTAWTIGTVQSPNQAPTINFLLDSPDPVVIGSDLTLTANVSDPDPGDAVEKVEFYRDSNSNFVLDLGADAKLGEDTSSIGGWTWSGSTAAFALGSGTYFARAYDGETWSSSAAADGRIKPNPPPIADAGGPYIIDEGDSLSLTAAGSSDPDGEAMEYAWDIDGDATYTDAVGANPVLSWAQLQSLGIARGPYTGSVYVQVDDGHGNRVASQPAPLTVMNVGPTVSLPDLQRAYVGKQLTLPAVFTDPSSGETYTYRWQVVNAHGTLVTVSTASVLAFTPAEPGTYTITLEVTDDLGASGSDDITINTDFDLSPLQVSGDFTPVGGRMEASGVVLLGLKGAEAAFSPVLTVNGTVWYDSSGLHAQGAVIPSYGGLGQPAFTGSFVIEPGSAEGSVTAATGELAGLPVTYTALRLAEGSMDVQGHLVLPEDVSSVAVGIEGNHWLRFGRDGISLTGGAISLPDADINIRGVLELRASALSVEYVAATGSRPDQFMLHGRMEIPAVYGLTADLTGSNGIQISRGQVDLKGRIELPEPIRWPGGWKLSDVYLEVNTSTRELRGAGKLTMPPSDRSIEAELGFVAGSLDMMSLELDGLDIPIGNTGAYLHRISGGVGNLATSNPGNPNARPLVFKGGVGITAGPSFATVPLPDWVGGEIGGALLEINADAEWDRNHIILKGSADVLTDVLKESGSLEINWQQSFVSGSGNFRSIADLIRIDSSFRADFSYNLTMSGSGALHLPSIPWTPLKGQLVAEGKAYFQFRNDGDRSNDYLAMTGHLDLGLLGSRDAGVVIRADGTGDVIGDLTKLLAPQQAAAASATGMMAGESAGDPWRASTFLAPGARDILLYTEWLNAVAPAVFELQSPEGITYTPADLANTPDMGIIPTLSGGTSLAIGVRAASAGPWTIRVADTGLGETQSSAYAGTPAPSAVIASASLNTDTGVGQVSLQSIFASPTARVSLFYDTDSSGRDGVFISDTIISTTGPVFLDWEGFQSRSDAYYLYAVIDDGQHMPSFSGYAEIGRAQIRGNVWRDLRLDGAKGADELGVGDWTVFVDSDGNGRVDAGEPTTTSDAQGNFAIAGLLAGTYRVAVDLKAGWLRTYPQVPSHDVNLELSTAIAGGVNFGVSSASVSISDIAVLESQAGTRAATFNVSLSEPSARPISVHFTTSEGSAAISGSDYEAASGTLRFDPGEALMQTILVPITGDANVESDEWFEVNLTEAAGVTILDGQGIGRILDDDLPRSEFQVSTWVDEFQVESNVAMNADGDYVVVWSSFRQPGGEQWDVYGQRYNAVGTRQGEEFRVNTTVTGDQNFPKVAMDAAGNFVVAWSGSGPGDNMGIFAQRYNAAGTPLGSEFLVNTYTADQQSQAYVGMAPSGSFVVAWPSWGQDGFSSGIYGQRFGADGARLGEEFLVNTTVNGSQDGGYVAVGSDGRFLITWSSPQDSQGWASMARLYSASGEPLTGEFQVNVTTDWSQIAGAAAFDGAGNFVIAWSGNGAGDGSGIFLRRYDAAGVPLSGELLVNAYTRDSQADPSVAIDAAGNLVAVWTSEGQDGSGPGIYARRYDAAGVPQGSEVRVNQTTASRQEAPSVVMDGAGNAVVVWQGAGNGDDRGIFAQRFVAPGIVVSDAALAEGQTGTTALTFQISMSWPVNEAVTIKYATADGTAIAGSDYAAASGELVFTPGEAGDKTIVVQMLGDMVFESDEAFFLTVSDVTGTTILDAQGIGRVLDDDLPRSEFRVNSGLSEERLSREPAAAMNANGDSVVVWTTYGLDGEDRGVFGQRLDPTGQAIGPEFQVNSFTASEQTGATVAMDADGDFVVAWHSLNQDGSGWGIYAQRYNAAGVPLDTEFRVNSYTTGHQGAPSVAMDPGGDFVIVWESQGQDGDQYGIYGRRYDAQGTALGEDFKINTHTEGSQEGSAVAMDAAGRFVVTWMSLNQENAWGVFAQRFDAGGTPIGEEFRVNTYTDGVQQLPSIAMDAVGHFVIAWESHGQGGSSSSIYAQRYAASGEPIGAEFRVNSDTAGEQWSAAVAMNVTGEFTVAWHSYKQDGTEWGVYAQRFDREGGPQGGEFRVNETTERSQTFPALAMAPAGDVLVVWQENGFAILGQRFQLPQVQINDIVVSEGTGGETQATFTVGLSEPADKPVTVRYSIGDGAATAADGDYMPNSNTLIFEPGDVTKTISVMVNGDGKIESDEFFQINLTLDDLWSGWLVKSQGIARILDDDLPRSEFQVSTWLDEFQVESNVAMDAEGDYVVVWSSFRQPGGEQWDVYGQRYNAVGMRQGEEFRVNTTVTGDQNFPKVAMDAAGNFVVAWSGSGPGDNMGIFAQRYNAAGTPLGSEFLVNTYTTDQQSQAYVGMAPSGSFVVAWPSWGQDGFSSGIYGQRFGADGARLGEEFLVNTTVNGSQDGGYVAVGSDGRFLITWSSPQDSQGWASMARLYSASGEPLTGEFQVNVTTDWSQIAGAAAFDGAGNFVIAWGGNGAGDGSGIFLRRYDAAGVPLSGELLVNAYTRDSQADPSVAIDAAGNLVVVWTSEGQDGSGPGIYARRYDAAGVPQGSEVRVNQTTASRQEASSVVMDGAGNAVVVWQGAGNGDDRGIFALELGVAALYGTTAADAFYVVRDGDDLKIYSNPAGIGVPVLKTKLSDLTTVKISGAGGNDLVVLDLSGGSIPRLIIDGGAGANAILLRSLFASADLAISDTLIECTDSSIRYANASIALGLENSAGMSPVVTELNSLTLTGEAKVKIAGRAQDQVLVLSGLDIASGAQLDVQDNSIILKNVSDSAATAQELMDKVNTGRTGGTKAWEGPGIISANAKANEFGITTVGVLDNNSEGAPFKTSYYGVPVDAGTVILKYTYFGDTNLDGEITGSDYAVTDLAFWVPGPNPGWRNGDNNGDGVLDGSDYAIMDLAYWMQEAGKPLGSRTVKPAATGASGMPSLAWSDLPINAPSVAIKEEEASFLTDDIAVLA